MDELEHSQQVLGDDISQLKEQVAKVLELLERRYVNGNSSGVSHGQPVTLDPPSLASVPAQSYGLSPQGTIVPLMVHPTYPPQLLITNPQGIQWPPYSLPPGYTPSQTTNPPSHNPPMSTSNPQDPINLPNPDQASNGTPQTQPPFPIFMSYRFSPSYIPPHNINS
ncbi:hypothetical protein SESBI_44365 [Sesbania bispinosa]|nr:hypothetical protein SESBI_44365 [Sesbania bispinosa]